MQIAIVPRADVPPRTPRGMAVKTKALIEVLEKLQNGDEAAFVSGERPPNHYRAFAKKYCGRKLTVRRGLLDGEEGFFLYFQ